jgi:hypothetical protein
LKTSAGAKYAPNDLANVITLLGQDKIGLKVLLNGEPESRIAEPRENIIRMIGCLITL